MAFTTLGLMPGYRCNARCRSCLWGVRHVEGHRMNAKVACDWVDQAHGLGSLMLVGFSGGEAFLYPNEMKSVARYSGAKYGLPSVAATNGFWAVTPEKAEATLRSFYDVGLRYLLISVDDFHQEWIPLQRVSNCLGAAKTLGIKCTLQCVVTQTSNKLSYYLDALGVSKGPGLAASEIPCTPVGAAAKMISRSEFPTHEGVPSDYCTMLQALIVRPEGAVHLCCGPAFTLDTLTAGNLNKESLNSILDRAEWNPIFNALALGNGPSLLAATLADAGAADRMLHGYASSCHACQHILRQPGVKELLLDKLEAQRPELFLKRTILDQVTGDRTSDIFNI